MNKLGERKRGMYIWNVLYYLQKAKPNIVLALTVQHGWQQIWYLL
jgi:hypothetical protein